MFVHVEAPKLKKLVSYEKDGKRFYITPYGEFPSITTVLGWFPNPALEAWRQAVGEQEAERAATIGKMRGTALHNILEKYLKNERQTIVMPDMIESFRNMKPVLARINNIHQVECALYSKRLGLAGRTDVIGEFDGVLSVIDFKTSNREKHKEDISNYFQQGSGYANMYEEMTGVKIDQVVLLVACEDANVPQVLIERSKDHIGALEHKVFQYKEAHEC